MYGPNFCGEFLDIGAEPAQSHAPPKYGAKNSHISQMVLEGQDGYQTVCLVLQTLMALASTIVIVDPCIDI